MEDMEKWETKNLERVKLGPDIKSFLRGRSTNLSLTSKHF